jgi:tetratricopeptide (TPR) repeat protein
VALLKRLLDDSSAEFQEAIRLNPDDAVAHCNLANVLRQQGRFQEALKEVRRGHELGSRDPRWPHPSAQWVREAERRVQLDARLPRLLNGQDQPADAAERLALADLCQQPCKRLNAAAARWYGEAFAAEP